MKKHQYEQLKKAIMNLNWKAELNKIFEEYEDQQKELDSLFSPEERFNMDFVYAICYGTDKEKQVQKYCNELYKERLEKANENNLT